LRIQFLKRILIEKLNYLIVFSSFNIAVHSGKPRKSSGNSRTQAGSLVDFTVHDLILFKA
jgi:hypothetical protein